ncbi:hypothetical protein E3N88_45363 [Mikania micrantha]|uniref:HAT C-terminal dimerisation domain-containing protein n=1 Tax=Mikania micrantha TaxID=192012 RepID=A0A5N6L9C8_9ASTR|nr:hypothetical protein E3N88_45363 [Mikania micrantha]
MCLTEHYIDENWNLQKKVIKFCPISSHRGNDIGRAIENCLVDWGLQNVMTITVDNASSNDVAIEYLVGKMMNWGDRCILKGKWTHVRCIAHIINLILQEGIKELGTSVDRIRAAVRWVRLSPARLKKFKEFALLEKVECQKSLVLDVLTHWNSTYLMLSVASEYERAFKRFIEEDYVFSRDLQEGCGVLELTDWENARRLGCFLEHFYELTLRVSGTNYITSNTYLDSISFMDSVLKQCMSSNDDQLSNMAMSMTLKFNKYWGDLNKFNLLVFIASLFDPRTKLAYLKVNLRGMYGNETGDKVVQLCENALLEIFNDYKRIHSDVHSNKASSSSSKIVNEETSSTKGFSLFGNVDDTFKSLRERKMAEVKRQKAELGVTEDLKTELDRYLKEEIEGDDVWFESQDFIVLGWWRKKSPAFPILSLVARDILAIPISTVASESTSSTGGRVLDSFRSSLTPQAVEALICCQDWIRSNGVASNVEESIEDIDRLEAGH